MLGSKEALAEANRDLENIKNDPEDSRSKDKSYRNLGFKNPRVSEPSRQS